MEEYEYFEMRVIPIMVAKVLQDVGREKGYLERFGASEAEPDDYYVYICEGMGEARDFWFSQEVGPCMDTCWYFSDQGMMDFYRLCRDWSRQRSVRLKDNPYMKQAEREVYEQMGFNSWYYTYHLHTRVNHRWASGIAFYCSPESNQEFPLLRALAEIFDYYWQTAKPLRYESWKYDQEQRAKVLFLPLPNEKKEAA